MWWNTWLTNKLAGRESGIVRVEVGSPLRSGTTQSYLRSRQVELGVVSAGEVDEGSWSNFTELADRGVGGVTDTWSLTSLGNEGEVLPDPVVLVKVKLARVCHIFRNVEGESCLAVASCCYSRCYLPDRRVGVWIIESITDYKRLVSGYSKFRVFSR